MNRMFLNQKIVCGMLCLCLMTEPLWAALTVELDDDEMACLQKIIYLNECSSNPEKLVIWPADEDFASLGIVHAIWYPRGRRGPFRETFPELLLFMKRHGQTLPEWLENCENLPWDDRDSFLRDSQSERMKSLRDFLLATRDLQTQFIVERVRKTLPDILSAVSDEERPLIEAKLGRVLGVPYGPLAVIDYINFKGEGVLETERSQGEGWGLLQVLRAMGETKEEDEILPEFVRAAKAVLDRRVEISPPGSKETDRIGGWKFRVQRYLMPPCEVK